MSDYTFDSHKDQIERRFPLPIAAVYRKCRVASPGDLGGRHKNLIDLYEAFIKFVCTVALQEARARIPNLKDRLPQKEKSLEFLRHPSLGSWVGLLRMLCSLDLGHVESRLLTAVEDWYTQSKSSADFGGLAPLGQISGLNVNTRAGKPIAEACNLFVTYRNKAIGHSANLRDEELGHRLPLLEAALVELIASADFLASMMPFAARRVEKTEDNRWKVTAELLVGSREEPAEIISDAEFEVSEVYLGHGPLASAGEGAIALGPFFLWQHNEELKRNELYYFNDALRTKLEYLSYVSGSHYFHKELHSGFEELIALKLRTGRGEKEETYAHLSAEERALRAEELYRRAVYWHEQGRDEDALEDLELSLEAERRPETYLRMAEIQHALGDPPAGILQTLTNCLELEPDNEEAARLFAKLGATEEGTEESVETEPDEETEAEPATVLHLLAPRLFREFGPLFWSAVLLVWYGVSAAAQYLFGAGENPVIYGLQLGCCLVLVVVIALGEPLFRRLRSPLSLQLGLMRLDRFNRWYGEHHDRLFGSLAVHEGRASLGRSSTGQRLYVASWLAFTLILGTAAFLLSGSFRAPPGLWPFRFLDYGLIYLLAYPSLRSVIMATWFIYSYSKLSLKPMLTTVNDVGIRAVSSLIALYLGLAAVAYSVYWILALFAVRVDSRADFFFIGLATAILLTWTFGMPLMIRRAMRQAKVKSIERYSSHIESAFSNFLSAPSDDNLARYQWLLKQQKVLRKIASWPLSFTHTLIFVVGCNLLIIVVDTLYVLARLDLLESTWRQVVGWFG